MVCYRQGSWGGRGVKKPKTNKKNIKHVPGVDVSKRRDFAKSHVIISEKKDKKAAKHMTKDLPYPYTSAAQYEASLRGAVGSEWSTRATVQKATMPRVVTKVRPTAPLYSPSLHLTIMRLEADDCFFYCRWAPSSTRFRNSGRGAALHSFATRFQALHSPFPPRFAFVSACLWDLGFRISHSDSSSRRQRGIMVVLVVGSVQQGKRAARAESHRAASGCAEC